MTKLGWAIAYWLFRLIVALGRILPTRLCYAVAAPVADVCYLAFRERRRHLVANLTRVTGDPVAARRAARGCFRHFSKYVIDFFQLPSLGGETLQSRVDFDDWQALDDVFAEGKGIVLVTLHLGQWEIGAASVAAHGYPVNVLAEPIPYRPLDDLVQEFRRNLGMQVISANRPVAGLVRAFRRRGFLAMLLDVVEPGHGVRVDFFGAKAEMSDAPARIALRSGARVVPAVAIRRSADPRVLTSIVDTGLRFEPTGVEEADVVALTQAIVLSLESQVRRYPEQWFAFHPIWTEAPEAATPGEKGDWRNQFALHLANRLVAWLPKGPAYRLGEAVADLALRLRSGMRGDVEDNMRHVLGSGADDSQVRRVAREAVRNVCRYYADLIRLANTTPAELLRTEVVVTGLSRLKAAQAAGRGAVIATAHYGNPEMASQVAAELGIDVIVLSEPLNPPEFSELVHRLRAVHGARYEEVGYSAISHCLRHLRSGGSVAITCDRDIQGTGIPLPFFGEMTRLPLGAVELAMRTKSALVPAYCRRQRGGYELVFEEPLPLVDTGRHDDDAKANAMALLARAESWIRSDPGQWMVLDRVWKPLATSDRAEQGKMPPGATITR